MNENEKVPDDIEKDFHATHEVWMHVALVHGYNEMAKSAESLGTKIYFRICRDKATENALALGVTMKITHKEHILEIEKGPVHIRFTLDDIDLMRKCVAEYDAEKNNPSR